MFENDAIDQLAAIGAHFVIHDAGLMAVFEVNHERRMKVRQNSHDDSCLRLARGAVPGPAIFQLLPVGRGKIAGAAPPRN